ncbi:MAG: hypothetical protein KDD82_30445 [Planctomycetes bacterium]|nr:hypothetical protein [Planctomycetota bacterium]
MDAWLLSLAPLLGLLVNTLTQPVIQHLSGRGRPARSLALGFLAGLATGGGLVAWAAWRLDLALLDAGALVAVQLLSTAALGYGYFSFVNLNLASIRVRLLKEVARAGADGLPAAELQGLYDEEGMADGRLQRLLAGGHLRLEAGRHVNGKRSLLRIGHVIELLKHAILGRGSRLGAGEGQAR